MFTEELAFSTKYRDHLEDFTFWGLAKKLHWLCVKARRPGERLVLEFVSNLISCRASVRVGGTTF